MKKIFVLLLGMLLIASVAAAENIQAMTDLGEIQQKLDDGINIESAYYTDGYGFSTSEFATILPEEIAQLWEAVSAIEVEEKVDMSVTDWYPQIIFYLSDGTYGGVRFEATWLCIGADNYAISHDEAFWEVKDSLLHKYDSMKEEAITPREAVWNGSPEGEYGFEVLEIADDHLTLSLYAEDLYDRNAIENLQSGDIVMVNGFLYTVDFVRIHGMDDSEGDGDVARYEIFPAEEIWGYIAFEPISETACRCVTDDWSPCAYLADVQVALPLPERFIFLDALEEEQDAQTFLEDVSQEWYSPYNSHAWFENGQLVKIRHADYPEGPMW